MYEGFFHFHFVLPCYVGHDAYAATHVGTYYVSRIWQYEEWTEANLFLPITSNYRILFRMSSLGGDRLLIIGIVLVESGPTVSWYRN